MSNPRSKSPSPRHDSGYSQRPSDHFQHSRPTYGKDYSHGYGGYSSSAKTHGFPDWQPDDPKRREKYQSRSPPYDSHKGWKESSYRSKPGRKSPERLHSGNSRPVSRRSPERYRRSSRSLSPLSDDSLSSHHSKDRKSRGNNSRSAFTKQISHSPISVSSKSPSLSPVSRSPTPQRYRKSSVYRSRRDQHSPIDRSTNTRAYSNISRSHSRSRSRSPYWSHRGKRRSRSRSPAYKRTAHSPVTRRTAPHSQPIDRDRNVDHKRLTSSGANLKSLSQNSKHRKATASLSTGNKITSESSTYNSYQQQQPHQHHQDQQQLQQQQQQQQLATGYVYPMATMNYANSEAPQGQFSQWPSPQAPYGPVPQQNPTTMYQVASSASPVPMAPYNYGNMANYQDMGAGFPSYTYANMAPTPMGSGPNQIPHYNSNNPPGASTQAPASSSPLAATSSKTTSIQSKTKSKPSSSSSQRWSMGSVFQRVLTNVQLSKK